MNWRYSVDVDSGTMIVRADGLITGEELLQGAVTLTTDSRFNASSRVLLDFSAGDAWEITSDELVLLARHPRFSADTRTAAIVPLGLAQGFFGYWSASAHVGTAAVFHDRAQAVFWLNRSQPDGAHLTVSATTPP